MPSFRVMKTHESEDNTWIIYRAACHCGNPSCDLHLDIEYDRELNNITLRFYKDLYYCSWWFADCRDSFLWVTKIFGKKKGTDVQDWLEDRYYTVKDIWYRIKGAIRILATGRIKIEEYFLFENEKQIEEFIKALGEGKTEIREAMEKLKSKEEN